MHPLPSKAHVPTPVLGAVSNRGVWIIVIGAMSALAAGCAGPKAVERDAFVREQMAELVLPRAIDEAWPLAHELLSEQGYNGVDVPGAFQYESEWREDVPPSRFAGKLTKFSAQGIR